jgi:hypothetical protein
MVGLVNGLTMVVALYDMLGGFPTGQHCSELAHNFIMAGGSESFNLSNPKIWGTWEGDLRITCLMMSSERYSPSEF